MRADTHFSHFIDQAGVGESGGAVVCVPEVRLNTLPTPLAGTLDTTIVPILGKGKSTRIAPWAVQAAGEGNLAPVYS